MIAILRFTACQSQRATETQASASCGCSRSIPISAWTRAGLLLVEGLLVRQVRMLGTTSAELLGAGDLLRPADVDGDIAVPAPAEVEWTALAPVRVAALDEAFLAA